MKSGSYRSILSIALHGRSGTNILIATILSFTFSIAVILCTFGLMDGFDHLLKSGLRHSSGDLLITSRKGFFPLDKNLKNDISAVNPKFISPVVQTEAFAISQGQSKGVLVRGIESENFSQVTGLKITLEENSLAIGHELATALNLKVGDELALTFGRGNEISGSMPLVKLLKVSSIVNHGIFQKDLRFVYMNRSELASLLGVGEWVNLVMLGMFPAKAEIQDLTVFKKYQQTLRSNLESDFRIRPFWDEYDFLIEAVKVEKLSISIILQLIVVVAVFNIIAFVIFIMEKKAQDFFFLRAVGLSLNKVMRFWFLSILMMWSISCVGAFFLSKAFNWALQNLSIFKVPGEIYVLSKLDIKLDVMAHITVYGVSLVWVLLAAGIGYIRLRNRPIIQGLRQEFS